MPYGVSYAAIVFGVALLVIFRLGHVLVRKGLPSPPRSTPARALVVLGSGGHTGEMLALLRALPPTRYDPVIFVVVHGA
jgi:beta-1,4-N-acetylglucosaminyltransferase